MQPLQLQAGGEAEATQLVFMIAIFLLASFVAGRFLDRRRIGTLKAIFSSALSELDPTHKARVSGTKMVLFTGQRLTENISQYKLSVFLLTRESPLNWMLARLAGRRDMAILTAWLSKGKPAEFDILRKGSPPHRRLLKSARLRRKLLDEGGMVIRLLHLQEPDLLVKARRALGELEKFDELWSFSLRRAKPELVVNFSVSGPAPRGVKALLLGIDEAVRAASS